MARTPPAGPVLSRRQLNRATLERQLLLGRVPMPAVDAVTHLFGLQAQVPLVPYTTLWNRLEGFEPEQLAAPLRDRVLVRTALMRSTVHLVTADDAVTLRPRMHVVLARAFGGTAWARRLRGSGAHLDPDRDAFLAVAHDLLRQRPRPRAALGPLLAERFPELDAASMTWAATYLLPVLQVTPRGVWGQQGQATWTTLSAWLGDGADRAEPTALDSLVLRYLAGFGPASVKDVQAWCGLTRLREVVDGLGDRLRHYRTDDGAALVDLADATLPDQDTPAPVRFLAEYDNVILGYADRTRILAGGDYQPLPAGPGGAVGTVLVDGLASAMWALRRSGDAATLVVRPSVPLSAGQQAAVVDEGARLLGFLAPAADHEVGWDR